MPYQFTTPTLSRPVNRSRLWSRFHYNVGETLLKRDDGSYALPSETNDDEAIAAAAIAYLGGHVYVVSDDEAADLTTAGYGALLIDVADLPNPPDPNIDPSEFGAGSYGDGIYGS